MSVFENKTCADYGHPGCPICDQIDFDALPCDPHDRECTQEQFRAAPDAWLSQAASIGAVAITRDGKPIAVLSALSSKPDRPEPQRTDFEDFSIDPIAWLHEHVSPDAAERFRAAWRSAANARLPFAEYTLPETERALRRRTLVPTSHWAEGYRCAAIDFAPPTEPNRPHHLVWSGVEWIDDRCGCRYHPDDDNQTHGGGPHVHPCEKHRANPEAES